MSIDPGTYRFGPGNGELLVKTGREGVAAKAGKELTLEVGEWEGCLEVRDDPSQMRVELTADGGSLIVQDDRGGVTTLTDLDKEAIQHNIDEDILKQSQIKFRSTSAEPGDQEGHIRVEGELEILGQSSQITFDLMVGPGDAEASDDEDDAEAASDDDDDDDDDEDGDDGDGDGEDESDDDGDGDGEDQSDGDDESTVKATAVLRQSDFGIDQYSALMGMIKASDEVEVAFSGKLKQPE